MDFAVVRRCATIISSNQPKEREPAMMIVTQAMAVEVDPTQVWSVGTTCAMCPATIGLVEVEDGEVRLLLWDPCFSVRYDGEGVLLCMDCLSLTDSGEQQLYRIVQPDGRFAHTSSTDVAAAAAMDEGVVVRVLVPVQPHLVTADLAGRVT